MGRVMGTFKIVNHPIAPNVVAWLGTRCQACNGHVFPMEDRLCPSRTIPPRDRATDPNWFVVCGSLRRVRDGRHYWRCMCRSQWFPYEKLVAEQDIRDKKLNTVLSWGIWVGDWRKNSTDWILESGHCDRTGESARGRGGEPPTLWRCRCVCGMERDIPHSDLTSWRTLSCGCRPDADVRTELQLKQREAQRD